MTDYCLNKINNRYCDGEKDCAGGDDEPGKDVCGERICPVKN